MLHASISPLGSLTFCEHWVGRHAAKRALFQWKSLAAGRHGAPMATRATVPPGQPPACRRHGFLLNLPLGSALAIDTVLDSQAVVMSMGSIENKPRTRPIEPHPGNSCKLFAIAARVLSFATWSCVIIMGYHVSPTRGLRPWTEQKRPSTQCLTSKPWSGRWYRSRQPLPPQVACAFHRSAYQVDRQLSQKTFVTIISSPRSYVTRGPFSGCAPFLRSSSPSCHEDFPLRLPRQGQRLRHALHKRLWFLVRVQVPLFGDLQHGQHVKTKAKSQQASLLSLSFISLPSTSVSAFMDKGAETVTHLSLYRIG